jgi:CMP-N-acetylneuraminic acid synthetase
MRTDRGYTRCGMRVVGFVPSKLTSKRLPRKNVRPLGGVPLINHVLRTLSRAPDVDETIVYASDDEVMGYVDTGLDCRFVKRPAWLDQDTALVEDFVGSFVEAIPSDVVVLLHATSPFISPTTVSTCVRAVTSGEHESAFAAQELRRFAWFDGQPLNYALDKPTPRTQDLSPVLVEQSGLYVFTRDLFSRTRCRIGDKPYIHLVDDFEGHDIDTNEEFELAEAMLLTRAHRRA